MKATGIVLVFLIVAAVAIGLLDLGFTQLIKWLATIFN
jgi:preprotein translocase subunit SecE